MQKILINTQHGGYNLSDVAIMKLLELKGIVTYPEKGIFGEFNIYFLTPRTGNTHDDNARKAFNIDKIKRDDPDLIRVVEELGVDVASGRFCQLKIVEIPDDIKWIIEEYDGLEWVAEDHETWS
jgi:hypothetical protein